MTRTILRAIWVLVLALSGLGCEDNKKSSPPTVPDPNGITIPKPAGKGG